MSADSEPPASPEPVSTNAGPALPPAEDTNAPEYLPQKRRHKKPDPPEFNFSDDPDDEILLLGTLLQKLLARKQAEAAEPESRTTIKRFVQKNTAPPGAASSTTGPEDTDDAPAALSRLTPRLSARPGDDQWAMPRRGWSALYLIFCSGLALTAFLVGRGASHPAASPPGGVAPAGTPTPPWNATALGKLDQILSVDQGGDLKSAAAQALDLRTKVGGSLELDLYLASLTTRLGHPNNAEADLSRLLQSSMQPLQAAAVHESLAFAFTRQRNFRRAAETFADAVRLDPFDPENYYRWGEVLRRQGRLQDAIDKFGEALQRLPAGAAERESQRECAAFKLRLAQIELGRDADLRPDLAAHLREPSPGGYWLLTAAAFALQHNDVPGATDALQRARAALPPGQYAALIDDYYFHTYALKPELAALFPPPVPGSKQQTLARMVYFVDP